MANQLKQSILAKTDVKINIRDKSALQSDPPWYEFHSQHQVHQYHAMIEHHAQQLQVDADLVKAIMYMETTHGYYDALPALFDANKSILPMNIHTSYWKGLGFSREALKNPEMNIVVGITLIKGIQERLLDPTIQKIATLYNNTAATSVSEYGARVERIYLSKLFSHHPDVELPKTVKLTQSEPTYPKFVKKEVVCQSSKTHRAMYQSLKDSTEQKKVGDEFDMEAQSTPLLQPK